MLFLIRFFFLLEWHPPEILELKVIKASNPVENIERWCVAFRLMQEIIDEGRSPYCENFIAGFLEIYPEMTRMEIFSIYESLNPREVFAFLFFVSFVSSVNIFSSTIHQKKKCFYLSIQLSSQAKPISDL